MHLHPARTMPFRDLLEALRVEVAKRMITEVAGEDGLAIFNYSRACTYSCGWNPITRMARGLILDLCKGVVVATPFAKFFNYGENGYAIPKLPFESFEKMDGSLGIVYWHAGRWQVATRGSFVSEPAMWATVWLHRHIEIDRLVPGNTYLVEIIYSGNRMVIHYDFEGCVLLAAYDQIGHELTSSELEDTAELTGFRVAKRYAHSSLDEIIDIAKTLDAEQEGFVIRFVDGTRLKIKGKDYCRIHRVVSGVTPLRVWELMLAMDDLVAVRRELPEEFLNDFDRIHFLLNEKLDGLLRTIDDEAARWFGHSDQELGLVLPSIAQPARTFVFARRKRGQKWIEHPRTRLTAFNLFRPDGNRLDGYEASTLVTRCQFDDGA